MPDFKYVKICENEYTKEELLEIGNVVSSLFLVENLEINEIHDHIETLNRIVSKEDMEAVRLFVRWLVYQVNNDRVCKELLESIEKATTKKEVSNMFAKTAQKLKESWFEEGVQKGIEKGREEGREEGEVGLLIRLLKKKFGRRFTKDMEAKAAKLSVSRIKEISDKIFEMGIEELVRFLKRD